MNGGTKLGRLVRPEHLCATTVRLARREMVYQCLDGDRNLYLVERGQVKAVAGSMDGKECLLGIYSTGDVFGELCLVEPRRTETVIAMTSTVLRQISAAKVVAALSDAGLRAEFLRYLAGRLVEQQQLITELVTSDSEHRLAAVLLHLARKLGRREGSLLRIEERITQDELAAMVGTTRSRVGHFLKGFCDSGLVWRAPDCFLLVSEARLAAFAARGGHRLPMRSPAVDRGTPQRAAA